MITLHVWEDLQDNCRISIVTTQTFDSHPQKQHKTTFQRLNGCMVSNYKVVYVFSNNHFLPSPRYVISAHT